MSLRIDFTTKSILKQSNTVKSHTFMDIGTDNFRLYKNRITGKETISDSNTSKFDKEAIKNSLNNIFNFRTGDAPLLPEFGIGQLYELLYSTADKYTMDKIVKTMNSIISAWEPRIQVTSMPIQQMDNNSYSITINYIIPALKEADNYVFAFQK